jgi:hypothetical protein
MDIITNTMTAWTPSFGMSTLRTSTVGHRCAPVRALGVDVVAVQGGAAIIAPRVKDAPGSPAWRPPTS